MWRMWCCKKTVAFCWYIITRDDDKIGLLGKLRQKYSFQKIVAKVSQVVKETQLQLALHENITKLEY